VTHSLNTVAPCALGCRLKGLGGLLTFRRSSNKLSHTRRHGTGHAGRAGRAGTRETENELAIRLAYRKAYGLYYALYHI